MSFWIFLVRRSSRSTAIFLIVSKEIQKYDRQNFIFFQKRNIFKFGIQNCKTKKFAISKISNKKFRTIHYFTNIKYKRNSRKYVLSKKSLQKYFCEKKNFRQKKMDKKIFVKKICRKKTFEKNFLNNFCNFFIFEKKSRLKVG